MRPAFALNLANSGQVRNHQGKATKEGRRKLNPTLLGPAISFNFMNCPLCTQVISHRSLDYIVGNYKELLEQVKVVPHFLFPLFSSYSFLCNIKTKALQRLEIEGLTTDPRITDPESEYHNKPGAYAMNIFSFYQCYICKVRFYISCYPSFNMTIFRMRILEVEDNVKWYFFSIFSLHHPLAFFSDELRSLRRGQIQRHSIRQNCCVEVAALSMRNVKSTEKNICML